MLFFMTRLICCVFVLYLFLFFRSVDGLGEFVNLEELVLDNNDISTMTSFPHLPHLHTLTLNKNKVSTLKAIFRGVFFMIIEPPHWKTNNVVFEQVQHNLACTVTEES